MAHKIQLYFYLLISHHSVLLFARYVVRYAFIYLLLTALIASEILLGRQVLYSHPDPEKIPQMHLRNIVTNVLIVHQIPIRISILIIP